MVCYTVYFTLDNGARRQALLTVISVDQFRPTWLDSPVMLKYAGEYDGEDGDACQSLVAVIRSRDAGVK